VSDVHRTRVPLNCVDPKTAIIHDTYKSPNDISKGRTSCGLFFTFAIYTRGYGPIDPVFTGTNEGATCLVCIAIGHR